MQDIERFQWTDEIKQALEKQIAQKVRQPYGVGEGSYCPSCGTGVSKEFCGKCGQKLKWE